MTKHSHFLNIPINIIPKKYLVLIIILLLFIVFTFITIHYNNHIIKWNLNKNEYKENFANSSPSNYNNIVYYKCPDKKVGDILNNVFSKNNISPVSPKTPDDWTVYLPCGYNGVEADLAKLNVTNKNTYNLNGDVFNNTTPRYVFGVNGCDNIVSKNNLWKLLMECYGRDGAAKLMPETYILFDNADMELFKRDFKSGNTYILKKNLQRKEGIKLTKNYEEIISPNALVENYKVVQNYMTDVYLINGRKVNLRIYLLVVIQDNVTRFFLSSLGKCIYTNKLYDDSNMDFESNITSYNLDVSIYKKNPRDLEQLKTFLNQKQNGAGRRLFEKINEKMKLITKCISKDMYQSDNLKNKNIVSFQLFGIDVLFNKNLEPFLLECNKGPDMNPKDDEDEIIKYKVQEDMLKTVGILSSIENESSTNSFYELI